MTSGSSVFDLRVDEQDGRDASEKSPRGVRILGGAVKNATANFHHLTAPPSLGDVLSQCTNRRSKSRNSVAWTVGAVARSCDRPLDFNDKRR